MVHVAQVHEFDEVTVEIPGKEEGMPAGRPFRPAEAFDAPGLQIVVPALQVTDVERDMGQTHLVPGNGARGQLRLERENLEDRPPRDPDPADFAAPLLPFDAEEGAHPLRIRVGDADQRAAEDLPVELHRALEVRHGDAAVAEGSRSHRSFWMIWSAARNACATMVRPGLTAADEGKKEASTTNRFPTSCARQKGSSTERRGSVPKTIVPHWCVVLRLPCECLTTSQ